MNVACPKFCKNLRAVQVLAVVAFIFGVATIVSGGQVLFGPEEKRIAAGAYVPFVLWFNFLAGFAYLAAAVGLFVRVKWGAYLAMGIAAATVVMFAAFGFHIIMGGDFEARTVGAMTLRTGVWLIIACVAMFTTTT